MFNKDRKIERPIKKGKSQRQTTNSFVNASRKTSAVTRSGNNAKKYSTSGNEFLDAFTNISNYREVRKFEDIRNDMDVLMSIDPITTVKLTIYMRAITRDIKDYTGKSLGTHRGAGLKHEPIMRMMYLAVYYPKLFQRNLDKFILAGSWKDVFEMLRYDLQSNDWNNRKLNWGWIVQFIINHLSNNQARDYILKYLPQIYSASNQDTPRAIINTQIGKYIASKMDKTYEEYTNLKKSGLAHIWQQLISQERFDEINWDLIPGRAKNKLVMGKFLANQGLEKSYNKWLESKPVVPYTGYIYELAKQVDKCKSPHQEMTLDKQFQMLLEKGATSEQTSNLLVAGDFSGSMTSSIPGEKISALDVCKSMVIALSQMLKGDFHKCFVEFASTTRFRQIKTDGLVKPWRELSRLCGVGNTNFLSVVDFICQKRREGVDLADFPTGILAISDGEFDPGDLGKTNLQTMKRKLRDADFPREYIDNFKVILWNIPNNFYGRKKGTAFETFGNHDNVFYIGGFDPSVISFFFGSKTKRAPRTAEELFEAAMDQPLLNMIS
jgi:hypothetical protein